MSKYVEKICDVLTLLKYAKNAAKCQIIIIIIIIITAICIVQNRLRATNALSGSSSTVTT